MNLRQTTWCVLLAGLLLGCEGDSAGQVVKGKVSYRGVPLKAGSIAFTPDLQRGNAGDVAMAEIQADGTFAFAALPAGWYRVTVVSVDMTPSAPGEQFASVRPLIPEKYRDPDQSGLSCEVRAGRGNEFHFQLE